MKPCTAEKSLAKIIQIQEKFYLCDIGRIRNPNTKRYTFHQQHSSGYIQRRLDYFVISNVLQESLKNPDILATFTNNHSSIRFFLSSKSEGMGGKGLWEHNNSLCEKNAYINSMEKHIISILENSRNENILMSKVCGNI